jgi:hypothetical protein
VTKKDYIKLTKLFVGLRAETNVETAIGILLARMARMLKEDNPSFDSAVFLRACKQEFMR